MRRQVVRGFAVLLHNVEIEGLRTKPPLYVDKEGFKSLPPPYPLLAQSGLGCHPVKVEVTGSNPVQGTRGEETVLEKWETRLRHFSNHTEIFWIVSV